LSLPLAGTQGQEKYQPVYSDQEEKVEKLVDLHIERLPEGVYLATCESIPGLVAQGRTVNETLEIARDVARKLVESMSSGGSNGSLA
jgi:predicted RNase H-like HicB family nuclease